MGDLSYVIALDIAKRMGPAPMPPWINDIDECVRIVELVQANVVPAWVNLGPMARPVWEPILDTAFDKWAKNQVSCPRVIDPKDRKNIILRLWSACAGAGKMIDRKTMSGTTGEALRRSTFKDIDDEAAACPVFSAGMEAAVDWKDMLGQFGDIVLDGIDDPKHPIRVRYNAKSHP
jgi:hypothetical protein